MNIFVYGTLHIKEIWEQVTQTPFSATPAILNNHTIRLVDGQIYPTVMYSPGEKAEGGLIQSVTKEVVARLDAFEGPEYRRIEITLELPAVAASMYLLKENKKISPLLWCEATFRKKHLQSVLNEIK